MKRRQIIVGYVVPALIVLVMTSVALWRHNHPRMLPLSQCSEVFQRYHDTPGIQADFIKNFHINDTITVDVTLLTATDTAAWDRLMADFNIPQYPPEVMALVMQGDAAVTILPFDRDSLLPHDDGSTMGSNLLVTYSYKLMSVCLFTIDEEAQIDAIIHHSVNKL